MVAGEYVMKTLFDKMHAEDATRDTMIITAVTEGSTLNAATKAYAAWAKDNGLTSAIVSHKAAALTNIFDQYGDAALTVKDVQSIIPDLVQEYGVADSTARDYVKTHCEQYGLAYPVLNPRDAIFAWFKAVDGVADKAEFMAYAEDELGRSKSNANEYWKGYELHLHLVG